MRTTRSTRTLAAAATLALGSSLLTATTPAEAATMYYGQVTSKTLTVRTAPSLRAAKDGYFGKEQIMLVCKVRGESVRGNDIWYKVPIQGVGFVSARYVRNVGNAPRWCTGNRVPVKALVNIPVRKAPLTAAAQVRTVRKGSTITAVCAVPSQQKNGPQWYYLGDGRWISSKYLRQNMPTSPCI